MRRNSIVVRPAKNDDFDALLALYRERGTECDGNKLKNKLCNVVGDVSQGLFVAYRGKKFLGYLHMRLIRSLHEEDYVELVDFYVREDCRRKGAGALLLGTAEYWCMQSVYFETRFFRGDLSAQLKEFLIKNGYSKISDNVLNKIILLKNY